MKWKNIDFDIGEWMPLEMFVPVIGQMGKVFTDALSSFAKIVLFYT